MSVPSFALVVGLLTFGPIGVQESLIVTLKVAVTYGPDVTVTWDGGGGLITQCALLVAVEWAQEVDIFLLPSSGSFLFLNLTEEVTHSFQCTCFDQSEGVYKSQSISVVPGSPTTPPPSTTNQVTMLESHANQNNTDSVTEGVFGTIGGGLLLLIIYGFCRKWLGDERLRAIFRFPRLNRVVIYQMFDH
ncbi:uncharacterized protein ACWYII_044417 isoform 1-T1 [Salvelinus alpinus]